VGTTQGGTIMLYIVAIIVALVVLVAVFRNTPSSLFGGQSLAQRFKQNLDAERAKRPQR